MPQLVRSPFNVHERFKHFLLRTRKKGLFFCTPTIPTILRRNGIFTHPSRMCRVCLSLIEDEVAADIGLDP